MPVSGAGLFVPQAKFWYLRSYMWGLSVRINLDGVQDGRFFRFGTGAPGTQLFTISIAERVFDWSSNNYTLDFTIEDSFYQDLPDLTMHPMNYSLAYFAAGDKGRPHWVFFPFGLPFVDDHFFELPPAPPTYWLPPVE